MPASRRAILFSVGEERRETFVIRSIKGSHRLTSGRSGLRDTKSQHYITSLKTLLRRLPMRSISLCRQTAPPRGSGNKMDRKPVRYVDTDSNSFLLLLLF